jgi:hypothetical protein
MTPDSGIFEGISWSVSRPVKLSFRRTLVSAGFIGRDKKLIGGTTPPRAFAGFGGEPALALMDAVV